MPEEESPKVSIGTPITIPSVPEKSFPITWILDFSARAQEEEGASLYVNACPYNSETKERLLSVQQECRVPLFRLMTERPKAYAAWVAIAEAIPEIYGFAAELEAENTQAEWSAVET